MPTAGQDRPLQRPQGFRVWFSVLVQTRACEAKPCEPAMATGGQEPDLRIRTKAVRPVLRKRISNWRGNEEVEKGQVKRSQLLAFPVLVCKDGANAAVLSDMLVTISYCRYKRVHVVPLALLLVIPYTLHAKP